VLEDLTQRIVEFRDVRDWKQFHSPKNLATSIVIESAELLELFQWSNESTMADDIETNREDIERELADILIYCLLMAHDLDIDAPAAILAKLQENEGKYPESLTRGRSTKYDKL